MRSVIAGVTGSPGSGKTTVSELLKKQGVCVIDVDKAGRWVLEKSLLARQKLRDHFGDTVFFADGNVDRKTLGDIVFSDAGQKLVLDQIVHPVMINRVRSLIQQCIVNQDSPYVIIDAALLIELSLHREIDYVITVTAPLETRLERLQQRHKVSPEKAIQMTNAQLSQDDKVNVSDRIVDNSGDLAALEQQVAILHRELIDKSKMI